MTINKFLVALVGTVLVAVQSGLQDGWDWRLDSLAVAAALLASIGVYMADNTNVAPAAKTTVAFLLSVTGAASTYFVDGVFSGANLLTAVIMAGVVAGVWTVTNKKQYDLAA